MRIKAITREIEVNDMVILDFIEILKSKNKKIIDKIIKYVVFSYEIFLYHMVEAEKSGSVKRKKYLKKNRENIIKWALVREFKKYDSFRENNDK